VASSTVLAVTTDLLGCDWLERKGSRHRIASATPTNAHNLTGASDPVSRLRLASYALTSVPFFSPCRKISNPPAPGVVARPPHVRGIRPSRVRTSKITVANLRPAVICEGRHRTRHGRTGVLNRSRLLRASRLCVRKDGQPTLSPVFLLQVHHRNGWSTDGSGQLKGCHRTTDVAAHARIGAVHDRHSSAREWISTTTLCAGRNQLPRSSSTLRYPPGVYHGLRSEVTK